jgi:hypothetical protein
MPTRLPPVVPKSTAGTDGASPPPPDTPWPSRPVLQSGSTPAHPRPRRQMPVKERSEAAAYVALPRPRPGRGAGGRRYRIHPETVNGSTPLRVSTGQTWLPRQDEAALAHRPQARETMLIEPSEVRRCPR